MANYLNTRIRLKYDSYANWTQANPSLLEGEVAVVYIESGNTQEVNSVVAPQVLFKVGPGNFNTLPWASAKAADVYSWAKAENLTVEKASGETGNVVSSIEWDSENKKIIYKTAAVATSEGMKDLQDAVAALNTLIENNQEAWEKDDNTTYTVAKTDKGFTLTPSEGDATTITFEYLTDTEVQSKIEAYTYNKDTIDSKVKAVQDAVDAIEIPTELGVMSVSGKEAIVTTGTDAVEVSLKLDASGNVVLSQGTDGLKAAIDLSAYQTIANDKDTKYGISYDSNNKVIKLIENGSDSQISAADFIKDGMLEKVEVDNDNNTITFTWNTDGESTVTTVELDKLADIYTAAQNATEVQVAISNTNEVSATLVNGGVSEAKLATAVADKLNHGESAYNTIEANKAKWEEKTVVADSTTNGNILVDGNEVKVYDDTDLSGRVTAIEDKKLVEYYEATELDTSKPVFILCCGNATELV